MSYKPKLYVPDYTGYARPFLDLFDLTNDLREASVVMFTGGADIDPSIYGQPRGKFTDPPSVRDRRELQIYETALAKKKKFLGICRGAQLLCALAGGSLAQHIEGHGTGWHKVSTNDGDELLFNTLHHQMMVPWAVQDHELLAWTEVLSDVHLDGHNKNIKVEVEPEVVFFPSTNALGIQCHPEFGYAQNDPAMHYFKELIKEKLL